jgi:hypothetical protein
MNKFTNHEYEGSTKERKKNLAPKETGEYEGSICIASFLTTPGTCGHTKVRM